MLNALKNATNYAYTENGALSHKTTKSAVLDFFAQAGAFRNRSEQEIIDAFVGALSENPLLAMKSLFYFRDVRGGQGERRTFRVILEYLADVHTSYVRKNLHLISEYGRWDDLYVLFGTHLEKEAGELIRIQFEKDMKSEFPSLLAKWLKSENASSRETKLLARKTQKLLGLTPRQYRVSLSRLRDKIRLVETQITQREYDEIDYSKLPSKAGLKYREAFKRNDGDRYQAFLDSVQKGESKINTKTLFPYEVSRTSRKNGFRHDQSLDAMWDNLPDYFDGIEENSIVVTDTSSSMTWEQDGLAMDIAISLGLYVAERNKGVFHNHFMTFNDRPQLIEVRGISLGEKLRLIHNAPWGGSTNIEAVFNLILDTAIKNKLKQSEMVGRIYIVSDMEFNSCVTGGNNQTLFQTIRTRYENFGYELPQLVFWNVNARNTQFPMTMTDTGVQLVSGASPSIFTNLLKGQYMSAYDMMLDVLNGERYSQVTI